MKKKVMLISGMLLTLIIVISTIFIVNKNSTNNEVVKKDKIINNNSFLTLMLEQSDGSYQESTSNTWPGEGYIFNKKLSSCQNGGELDYDSENNKVILYNNKSDGCYIYFDLYNKPQINSINLGEVRNNSITISVSATEGTNPVSNYYYIINDEVPISTTSNTYTFSGLNSATTYNIEVYVIDSLGYESNRATLSVETENPLLLANWVIDQYNGVQGNNGIYYHTSSLENSAGDNSYRYSGANPNNYVCFGSDAAICPEDNLYRIIGIFDNQIKLIKKTSASYYLLGSDGAYWGQTYNFEWNNDTNTNTWSESDLNTVNLNVNYLNNIGITWSNKIAEHTWKIGGIKSSDLSNTQTAYNYEVGLNSLEITYKAKIGLMYISDYGYASQANYWTIALDTDDVLKNNNWMCSRNSDWTISPISTTNNIVFRIWGACSVNSNTIDGTSVIRPTFYLNSDVTYVSGSGTSSDPIRID